MAEQNSFNLMLSGRESQYIGWKDFSAYKSF